MFEEEIVTLRRLIRDNLTNARKHREFTEFAMSDPSVRKYWTNEHQRNSTRIYWSMMERAHRMRSELYGMFTLQELFG